MSKDKIADWFQLTFLLGMLFVFKQLLYLYQQCLQQGVITSEWNSCIKAFGFDLLTSVVVALTFATPILLGAKRFRCFYKKIVFSLWFFPIFVEYLHLAIYKAPASPAVYSAIFGTDKNEVIGFLPAYLTLSLGVYVLLFMLAIIFTYYFSKVVSHKLSKNKLMAILFLPLVLMLALFIKGSTLKYYHFKRSSFRSIFAYIDYQNEIHRLEYAIKEKGKRQFKEVRKGKSLMGKSTVVFVVGESTGKHHWSLYGYDRKTSPLLDDLSTNLYCYKNVVSPNAHTIESLTKVLTFVNGNDNSKEFLYRHGSIIELLKQAGVKTYWLSNQAALGPFETPVTSLIYQADEKHFLSVGGNEEYDEKLIPLLKKSLKDTAQHKAIFLHLMGTHIPYRNRYPRSFNYFNLDFKHPFLELSDEERQVVSDYDNGIRYNDFVLSEVINCLENEKNPTAFLYFSDHGEEVYDFRSFYGHSDVVGSKYMYEIPFCLWLNTSFKKSRQDWVSRLPETLLSSYNTADLIHGMQDLCNVYCELYDSTKNIFNLYTDSTQLVDEIIKPQDKTKEEPLFLNIENRIWVHRVNTLERLNAVKDIFNGVEVDVVFNSSLGLFDVYHPPQKSIGLSLEELFASIKSDSNFSFWIDFKNLTVENQQEALEHLEYLNAKYSLKENILIESVESELLIPFTNKGYQTILYLPAFYKMSSNTFTSLLTEVSEEVEKGNYIGVSQNIGIYGILREGLSVVPKYLWDTKIDWSKPSDKEKAKRILGQDGSIEVLLVHFDTPGYR